MSDFVSDQPAVRCFLSFTHEDDGVLKFVDPLIRDLTYFCAAHHGRKVEFFVDRESIGWGGDWRDGIASGLDSATVFIPVITMHYFNESPWCREELNAFHAKATGLGLTELILPLLLFGHSLLAGDSDDASVRIIERLQYLDIQDAAIAGPGSPDWLRAMLKVSGKLIKAVESAETKLAVRAPQPPAQEELGLQEYDDKLIASGQRMEAESRLIIELLTALTGVLNRTFAEVEGRPREQLRARSIAAAEEIKPLATGIRASGSAFESAIAEVDSTIRSYLALVEEHGTPEMRAEAKEDIGKLAELLGDLEGVEQVLKHFLVQVRPLEMVSAPMRAAIGPLRLGTQSIQLGIQTLRQLDGAAWPGSSSTRG